MFCADCLECRCWAKCLYLCSSGLQQFWVILFFVQVLSFFWLISAYESLPKLYMFVLIISLSGISKHLLPLKCFSVVGVLQRAGPSQKPQTPMSTTKCISSLCTMRVEIPALGCLPKFPWPWSPRRVRQWPGRKGTYILRLELPSESAFYCKSKQ